MEEKENNTNNGYSGLSIFASVLAIVISGIALSSVYPRAESSIDYLGIIIGILALLVTVLIGWQVYNAIEMRSIISEINDIKTKFIISNERLENQDKRNESLVKAFYCMYEANHNDNIVTRYIASLKAIHCFLNADAPIDYLPLESLIKRLPKILSSIQNNNSDILNKFNDNEELCEEIYDNIIAALDKRIGSAFSLKRLIKEAHALRHKIHETIKSKR